MKAQVEGKRGKKKVKWIERVIADEEWCGYLPYWVGDTFLWEGM